MEVAKTKGRHKVKIYGVNDDKDPHEEAMGAWKRFCDRFSEEAHIKPRYVKYIINSFIRTVKELIADGYIVKLPGIGDFFIGHSEELTTRYTPLYRKFIYAGDKPKIRFKISKKWLEAFNREIVEQDAYVDDPIAFDCNASAVYIRFYKAKNRLLREVEVSKGRVRRPSPIYTTQDIDKLCEENGIFVPEFSGIKTIADVREIRKNRYYLYLKEKENGKTIS
jgi:nucleoid DNA-binding protein